MTYNLRAVVEFKDVWGFTIYNGEQVVCDSWSKNGFPMARNKDSEWQRQECERVADDTLEECRELWATLDRISET